MLRLLQADGIRRPFFYCLNPTAVWSVSAYTKSAMALLALFRISLQISVLYKCANCAIGTLGILQADF